MLSVSVPPDQREHFYTSLAQFRQHALFVTKSALVVQTTRHGPIYTWRCAGGQSSAAKVIQAVQDALTSRLVRRLQIMSVCLFFPLAHARATRSMRV